MKTSECIRAVISEELWDCKPDTDGLWDIKPDTVRSNGEFTGP